MKKSLIMLFVILTSLPVISKSVFAAGDAMARDYVAGNDGQNLAVLYYINKKAEKFVSNNKDLNADFQSSIGIARFVHFMEVNGMIIDPQIIIPFGGLDVSFDNLGDKKTSIGDITLLSAFWFINDPKSKTYVAFTPYLTIPTGSYDNNRPSVSMGTNRWSYTAELGISKGLGESSYIDFITAVDFYGKNDDYLGKVQHKDPTFSIQTIYSYDLTSTLVASAKYAYLIGGETQFDGLNQNNKIKTHTLTTGLTKQINKSNNIHFEYIEDIKVDNSFKNQGIRLRYLYSF